ncbi:hypothetical protein V1478_015097 [Vespula squamosa]|uniref:Uncharacterized protein n=1 Tax=Vespula squamosa TaxID=30214 RepID=A0ABD2A452_VESSQ
MSTYLNFNLPHFQPTTNHPPSFSTNYKSSTLNFDLNRGRVHEAKKRLYIEVAFTYRGSRGQLLDYRVIFEGFSEPFENSS